jgi:undecaprenyl-diphosphatase
MPGAQRRGPVESGSPRGLPWKSGHPMTVLQILILAVVQGACEMLPVSSSAHVIMVEKFMGLDPTDPAMTFLLVMLHTGTMFAVIAYFWSAWRARYFASRAAFWPFAKGVALATVLTGGIGLALMLLIERVVLRGSPRAEVEELFGNTYLIAAGLASVGVLIVLSGWREAAAHGRRGLGLAGAAWIGAIQALCLPFRGFSRSGATISTGLLLGIEKIAVEDFSFALAVVLTPAVVVKEGYRLLKANAAALAHGGGLLQITWPSLLGMGLSFLAALAALRWLSRWLERSQWHWFGYYCLLAAIAVFALAAR